MAGSNPQEKTALKASLDKLLATAKGDEKSKFEKDFAALEKIFQQYEAEKSSQIEWEKIEKLPDGSVKNYGDLEMVGTCGVAKMLKKIIVIKLNGGLGTTMGCSGPKSTLEVRDGLSFLDLTIKQIEHINETYKISIPLVLMNSFNTHEDTDKIVKKYKSVDIHTFNQSAFPRLKAEGFEPLPKDLNVNNELDSWYPPGHGDFYISFHNSGLLDKFVREGKEYLFLSNIDNLGATVDVNIVNMLFANTHEFLMEITDKTKADVKGGTLIQYNGKLNLLECAQVPKKHIEDFKDIRTFKYFNTNNIWVQLSALQRVIKENKLHMEVIYNPKSLKNGTKVVQLEIAVGAAMKCFENAIGLSVPRSRFLPVKKSSDLLLIKSNLFNLENGTLVLSPDRVFPTLPDVRLSDKYFKNVADFLARFGTIPDILDLDSLVVTGNVSFGGHVVLKGVVIVVANCGKSIVVPSGAHIENQIVTGNVQIESL